LLEAVMPLCHTPDERLFFQQVILTRIVAYPNFGPYADFSSSAPLIAECLQRLKFEGNSRLLTEQELPAVLHGLEERVDQIGLFDRSRFRRTFYQINQGARLARFLYPRSRMRRVNYRVRHLFKLLKRVLPALAFALKIRWR
jgi:hypothetical protein